MAAVGLWQCAMANVQAQVLSTFGIGPSLTASSRWTPSYPGIAARRALLGAGEIPQEGIGGGL